MKIREEQAQDLEGLISNLNLHSDLVPNSEFYVEVDQARFAPGYAPVRPLLVHWLEKLAQDNINDSKDEFLYKKLLVAGNRASGKTTELRKVAGELEELYHVIYISDIEKMASRFETEQDFLYYLMDYVIASVRDDQMLSKAVVRDVKRLYRYLEDSIFSEVKEEKLVSFDHSIDIESGAEAKASLFSSIASVFAKLGAKASFETETKETITKSIKNNFQEFMDYANQILLHINKELYKQGKMLLMVLDGLDKLDESKAKPLFLNADVMLPQLQCSMIVTFPIYLLYSPNKNMATMPYDREPLVLSMIKVHDKEGKPYMPGILAMRQIAEKRFNTEKLLKKGFSFEKFPEYTIDTSSITDFNGQLDVTILMSGGNLRDFFRLLTTAAENAVIFGEDKIADEHLVNAFNEVRTSYIRSCAKSYLPILKDVLESKEKDVVIRETPDDDTLLNVFNAGILIEYNGTRWCDVHPLMRDYIRRQVEHG